MKVGIITFHYAYNYGAVLQCLALYRTLIKLGVDVDVIQYVPKTFCEPLPYYRGWELKKGKVFQNLPKKLISVFHAPAMVKAFNEFRAIHLTYSSFCSEPHEISEAVKGYDALITGSDQVWHFSQHPPFFLEWNPPYKGKRISYAACCGHSDQPQERDDQINQWISRFNSISVRNSFSQKIVERMTGRNVPIVADPTLLIDFSDVQKIVELPYSKYIMMYTLGNQLKGGHAQAIQIIKDKVGNLPVVAVIPSAHKPNIAPWADVKLRRTGPAEWMNLIMNASFVYTDSFHGAVVALKYRRPFVVYCADTNRSPRINDFAERYGVMSHVVNDCVSLKNCISSRSFGNYEEPSMLIDEHVKLSIQYLSDSLHIQ